MNVHTPRKRINLLFLFLLLLVFSSCQNKCRHWDIVTIDSVCPPTTFSRISLPPCDSFNGFETEFLCSGGEICLYLNSLLLLFPSGQNPYALDVTVIINGINMEFVAERLDGGQRLKMPYEATEVIVNALWNDDEVIIKFGNYQETLVPDNFKNAYSL